MPSFDAYIDHGTIASGPGFDLVDEPGILVNSLSISATREKQEFKGANGAVQALRYKNPTISFDFDGYVDSLGLSDLSNFHPGTAITSLANYTGAIHGFDPADGVIVCEDPVREFGDDLTKTKSKFVQYPFVS